MKPLKCLTRKQLNILWLVHLKLGILYGVGTYAELGTRKSVIKTLEARKLVSRETLTKLGMEAIGVTK